MITHISGNKFIGDKITLRDGKKFGVKETTQELLDIVGDNSTTIDLIQKSFDDGVSRVELNTQLQDIVDTIIDIGWNDEKYRPQSMGYQGREMYPKYVMECLNKGCQDFPTMKRYGLVK
tara:strand:- start:377 stop:733 length:357 start_codon:yes stop_codon:yes gene_type:complete